MKKLLLYLLLSVWCVQATHDVTSTMQELYGSLNGYGISEQESAMIHGQGGNSTYGEITPQAITSLLDDLQLTSQDRFYDLGSGIGKVCVQVYLETPAQKVVGIELSPTRHRYAQQVKEKMNTQKLLQPSRSLDFWEQNITQVLLFDATVIFMCSTCFSEQLMEQLLKKFISIPRNVKIVTLKQLPHNDVFTLVKTYQLPMTWSPSSSVYLYQKQAASETKQPIISEIPKPSKKLALHRKNQNRPLLVNNTRCSRNKARRLSRGA